MACCVKLCGWCKDCVSKDEDDYSAFDKLSVGDYPEDDSWMDDDDPVQRNDDDPVQRDNDDAAQKDEISVEDATKEEMQP